MKKNYCLLMMAFLGLFSVSCHRNVFYEKMVTMEGESWNINNKVEYEFEITDSMTFYDFYINVGNNVDFETQNFYMFTLMWSQFISIAAIMAIGQERGDVLRKINSFLSRRFVSLKPENISSRWFKLCAKMMSRVLLMWELR